MTKTNDSSALYYLAQGLAAVAARQEPKDAARFCSQAAATVTQAMAKTSTPSALAWLAPGLAAVATRLEPKDAARFCAQAAATFTQAMAKTANPSALYSLSHGLVAVAACLEPKDAARHCAQAAAILTQAMAKTTLLHEEHLARALSAVLFREDASRIARRRQAVTLAVGTLSHPGAALAAPALLQPALQPLPLPPQQLVDLLKQPLFVGEARRLVLAQLARHYQRPFADQWAFVRFAQQKKLGLDFTTPPQRLVFPTGGEKK
jgi:hypothetical protein